MAARYGHVQVLQALADALVYTDAGPDQLRPLLRLGNSTQAILQRLINVSVGTS